MMPAWVYTLGRVLTEKADIEIPFTRLLANLFITIGPCLVGLAISRISPKIRAFTVKISKKFTLFLILTLLAGLFVTKIYVFRLMTVHGLLASGIPWLGFVLSAVIAYVCRLPRSQILTISIETGIQNSGIEFSQIYIFNFLKRLIRILYV